MADLRSKAYVNNTTGYSQLYLEQEKLFFSHPDFNCRFWSFTRSILFQGVADFYRRSGITPCPEENHFKFIFYSLFLVDLSRLSHFLAGERDSCGYWQNMRDSESRKVLIKKSVSEKAETDFLHVKQCCYYFVLPGLASHHTFEVYESPSLILLTASL